jgi:AbrB family looped-hinge helix DNA binding protein
VHTTLTSKGQFTLPKALRDKLHLSAGDRIEFVIDEDGSVRLLVKRESIRRLKGMLPKPRRPVSLEDMERAIEQGARS